MRKSALGHKRTLAGAFATLGERLLRRQAESHRGDDHDKYRKEHNFH